MKKSSAGVCVVLLATLFFLAWWLWIHDATKHPIEATLTGGSSAASTARAINSSQNRANATKPHLGAQLRELMESSNRPVSFFGKVIDQDGNPIPGVKVTLEIRYMKAVGPIGIGDTFDYPSVVTGQDGRFALTGAKGALLGLKSLEKVGYEPSPKAFNGTYWYWRDRDPYVPNEEKPEIFRMWKKAGAEKLVRRGIGEPIHYDGTPATFNLFTQDKIGAGDLRVTLERNPRQIKYGERNYEWTLTVETIDGGLLESNDEQMYLAPVEGYQPKLIIHMPADAPKWTDEKSVNLYLKLRGGKNYGRAELKVLVGADRPTTPFYITSFVNPSGSRNLEYDSTQNLLK